ncbi:MAG: hypothetical protein HZA53_00945 [Planctomycetes bacterium]|nr:hypothetical protein [Planctomycetota bacterium]
MHTHALLLSILLSALATPSRAQDRVRLKNGQELEGRVLLETPTKVVLRMGTKERELDPATLSEVQSIARTQGELVRRWSGLAPDDAARRMELAQEARAEGLPGEAEVLAWSVLATDSGHASAHLFLGHERRQATWMVREGPKWIRYDEFLLLRGDFSDAWRFSTLHYELRTNLELSLACVSLLEAELHYQAFLDWFRPELELYEVVERMQLELHAQQKNYPGGSGRAGFYDPDSNTVFANMSAGYAIDALVHEGTHALLHSTTERTKKSIGSLPAWVDESIADWMRFGRSGELGRPKYRKPGPGGYYFSMHASARDPLSFARVLALTAHDFNIGNVGLAYAQSYTLLQFCLHGAGGASSAKFYDYLRSCWAGKSSATDFKTAFGVKTNEFEPAWHAFARSVK